MIEDKVTGKDTNKATYQAELLVLEKVKLEGCNVNISFF
jgi:hypothetical protein